MISIEEIRKYYPNELHKFNRNLIREYLQYLILSIIFSHPTSRKLSFLGGTNLRIVHNLKRFSEDIDFDNKNLNFEEFKDLGEHIKQNLEKRGYIVETKLIQRDAMHCHIKFPNVLYEQKLSPIREEKILIQLDTFDQGVAYAPQIFILDKFEFFDQILITPKDVILSQKLWTITQRKRPKGRDFYDIMFLLQSTTPNMKFLEHKFNTSNKEEVKNIILKYTKNIDFKEIINDISPFIIDQKEVKKLENFNLYIKQAL